MKYFNIDDIYKKLNKYYEKGDIFRCYIENSTLFPIDITLKKISQKDIQNNYTTIIKQIKELKNSSLNFEYKQFNYSLIGVQNLPIKVTVENLERYLKLINKQDEYDEFINLYDNITDRYKSLKNYFLKKPFEVLAYKNQWDRFFLVVDYLLKYPNSNIYIRELSIKGIDTKFIEKYKKILDILLSNILDVQPLNGQSNFAFEKRYNLKYPLPQIRFRVLDKDICGLSDLTLTCEEFKNLNYKCKKVFIVENKITTLSFPKIKNSIVIFGCGYGISILKDIKWLNERDLYYWGDIDEDGFAILSQFRGYFSDVKSLLMDEKTIEKYKELKTEHKIKSKNKILKNLTKEEDIIYKRLQNDFYGTNFRLEQERLPFELIRQEILK